MGGTNLSRKTIALIGALIITALAAASGAGASPTAALPEA